MEIIGIEWKNLTEVFNSFGVELVNHSKNNLTFQNKIASGELRDSIQYLIKFDEKSIELDLQLLDYYKYVNDGRRAGKFPPLNKIEQWITIKPVIPRANSQGKLPTLKQLTFLIGRKIAEEGIQPTNFLNKAIELTYNDFEKQIDAAINADLEGFLNNTVKTIYK